MSLHDRANILDLTHGIASHNIQEAAFTIGINYGYFPAGTIHVVIVDPGVGSSRRNILVVTDRYCFIGPDNGVFSVIYEREKASLQVIHITADQYFLRAKSPTFQGRDVFAPVAAHLAGGIDFRKFGERIFDFKTLDLPLPNYKEKLLKGEIIHIDKFGNAMSNISGTDIANVSRYGSRGMMKIFLSGREIPMKEYYNQAADKMLYAVINSSDYLEFFINCGNAAEDYKVSIGDFVEVKLM